MKIIILMVSIFLANSAISKEVSDFQMGYNSGVYNTLLNNYYNEMIKIDDNKSVIKQYETCMMESFKGSILYPMKKQSEINIYLHEIHKECIDKIYISE